MSEDGHEPSEGIEDVESIQSFQSIGDPDVGDPDIEDIGEFGTTNGIEHIENGDATLRTSRAFLGSLNVGQLIVLLGMETTLDEDSGQIAYSPYLRASHSVEPGVRPTHPYQAPTHHVVAAVIVLRAIIDGDEEQYERLCSAYPELRTIDPSHLIRAGSFHDAQRISSQISRREPFIDPNVWSDRSEAWQKLLTYRDQCDTTIDQTHGLSTALQDCYAAASVAREEFALHGRSNRRVDALLDYGTAQGKLRAIAFDTRKQLADSLPLEREWVKSKRLLLCREI